MDESLPPQLNERFRWLVSPADRNHTPGEFVLYWMHNALRAHENPALDVAICLARQNGLPLLVYHALSEDYSYASDRYHAFILQGQRDVQRELIDRGIRSHFHLAGTGNRGPHLRDLTRRAAVLVTEEMPVQPLAGWLDRLVSRTTTPIALVDSSCVVAAPLVTKSYTRAFEYREATRHLYQARISRCYEEQDVDCDMFQGTLPFQSLNLQDVNLASLIGKCRIDHAIAPVADTPGGSRAGYKRWNEFRDCRLDHYSKRRNDATIHDGVSRMSAYLHFGMVSPLRLAREADAKGAEKYLDELLTWRELSFHFCCHNIDVIDSLDALPAWANETLEAHAGDHREANYCSEQLSRARSGERLWDASQRSLLKHGEMHNNVRMTWGKAFLPWASSPARAMQLTMDLNHRYALDGRDPSSYGGVLWCFGQFDRPFKPENNVFGTVRSRSCEEHERRIDINKYEKIVDRPIAARLPTVAVIGAGMGGLAAARTLKDHGLDVTVFDKSRGVGGRVATRRVDGMTFDHGAQYFTARDRRFSRSIQSWMQQGLVEPWMGRIIEWKSDGLHDEKLGTPRYVATPTMNALAKHLSEDLDVKVTTPVDKLQRESGGGWRLIGQEDRELGVFDTVLLNCPPQQALHLLAEQSDLCRTIEQVEMRPCWAMMLSTDALSDLEFEGAFVNEGPLSWVSHDGAKPGRQEPSRQTTWTVHASASWTEQHLESGETTVKKELLNAFRELFGSRLSDTWKPLHCDVHLWRYAIPANPLSEECLWDSDTSVGTCGDWCGASRVEGAFLSGISLAGTLLRQVTIDRPAFQASGKLRQPSLL
ncbi:MAG: FAD-dependent oxidoreductase [Rubripirellula sp.]